MINWSPQCNEFQVPTDAWLYLLSIPDSASVKDCAWCWLSYCSLEIHMGQYTYGPSQDICITLAHCCNLLWFDTGRLSPYPSGLLHWYWGNMIAPAPVKQPWRIWATQWSRDIATTKKDHSKTVHILWDIACIWHTTGQHFGFIHCQSLI